MKSTKSSGEAQAAGLGVAMMMPGSTVLAMGGATKTFQCLSTPFMAVFPCVFGWEEAFWLKENGHDRS